MLETLHSVNFFVHVLSLQLSPPYLPYRSLAPLEALYRALLLQPLLLSELD